MIIKNRGYTKKYIYGGANIFGSLWNLGKKAFKKFAPRLFDVGKKKALEFTKKQAETLGKKAGKKATNIAKSKISQLLANKKTGLNSLQQTEPTLIQMEAPTIDKPTNGINRGLTRGLGIKII